MFNRPVRRHTINRRKSVLFLVASEPAELQQILQQTKEPWIVLTMASEREALQGAQELSEAGQPPDLILLDLTMPTDGTDGAFGIWSKLIKLPEWEAIPSIFIGQSVDEDLILQAFEVGASDYIHPPYQEGIILEKIRVLLSPTVANVPRQVDDVLPGTVFDARYGIIRQIGKGGTSEVFLVEDLHNGARRALKLFSPKGHEAVEVEQERFRREIRVQIRLRHPNLIRVYDIGFVGSLFYYTMDYLSGGSLAERLKDGPLAPKRAFWIGAQLASAVQEIHTHGLQHRDVKPGNILFTSTGEPILTDFGLVLDNLAPRLTHQEIVIGTPLYMSPERLTLEEEIDQRSDIYSLGLLLYEMLAGRLPYAGQDLVQMHRTMMAGLPSPEVYQPDLPPQAEAICAKATAYQPSERYQDAHALEQELKDVHNALSQARALLLDDDPMMTGIFAKQLEALGVSCKAAKDAEDAIALARTWHPDVCLISVHPQSLGGTDFYQRLRQTPHIAKTPCLFVAPQWTEENAIKASRMGIVECISKPFPLRETALSIQSLIGKQQPTQQELRLRTVINDKYELIRQLSDGEQTLVYAALDRQSGRTHVLKTLQPTANADAHKDLLGEMEALQRCRHPNLPDLLGIGRFRGRPYFVATHVEGETLARYLSRREHLPLNASLALTIKLSRALDFLHSHGLIHGCICPENVMLSVSGKLTLIDMSQCRAINEANEGLYLGRARAPDISQKRLRVRYASPEQLRGETPHERSDLFALGLVFFELLTGIAPLAGCNAKEALKKLQQLPSPRQFQPSLPDGVVTLCHTMLAENPDDRDITAGLLERDCQQLLKAHQS